MNRHSLAFWRSLIRDVVIPLGGVALVFMQSFLPGERLGMLAAGLAMMGLPAVAYGARALDDKSKDDEAK